MNIREAQNFYTLDSKKYDLKKNKEFILWMNNIVTNDYYSFISIDELQDLIDNIANWYEIKYPERELESFEGTIYEDFKDIKSISNVMNIRQLLYRLPHNQLCLMECGYRAKNWGRRPIYKDGKEIDHKDVIYIQVDKKEEKNSFYNRRPYFLISAEYLTGNVILDCDVSSNIDIEDGIKLDELLNILSEKYNEKFDFTELKESVYDHECDIELRNKILQLVALKLLYSKSTIPERGYERAKRFINEFNKELSLSLSTEEIDNIMNRSYKDDDILHDYKISQSKKFGLIFSLYK